MAKGARRKFKAKVRSYDPKKPRASDYTPHDRLYARLHRMPYSAAKGVSPEALIDSISRRKVDTRDARAATRKAAGRRRGAASRRVGSAMGRWF